MSKPLTLEQLREMDGKKVLFKPSWFKNAEVFTVRLTNNLWHGYIVNGDGLCIELEAASERGVYAYPPTHIDREAWEGCEFCRNADFGEYGFKIGKRFSKISSACGSWSFPKDEQFAYCPKCGKPLSEEAWKELEKRVRGEK